MTNSILLAVTNRDTGFLSPELQIFQSFKPSRESKDEKGVRELLGLKDTTTDYFVKGVLGTVDAFPAVRTRFNESERSYDMTRLIRATDVITGGKLVPDTDGFPQVLRNPSEWPAVQTMVFQYLDSTTLSLDIGSVRHYAKYFPDTTGTLVVDWPAVSGVRGNLLPDAAIEAGYELVIDHEPVRYPHNLVKTKLENSTCFLNIIKNQGLNKAWYASDSAAEQVAVAALALGLSNKAVY